MVHGHFFGMGGFTLVDEAHRNDDPKSQNGKVLTLDDLKNHINSNLNPEFSLPTLTDEEIEDRSKADALSKIIAVLQTTWFLVQCIARHHQQLALTELELVTLALASLNFATYVIWWYKPLDVKVPSRIYKAVAAAPASAAMVPMAGPVPLEIGDNARRVCIGFTYNSW